MAAGRHGGYRYHEFRDREANLDVLKRKELSQEPFREQNRKWSRSSRDLLDVTGIMSRNLKEKETASRHFRPSPSMSNSGGGGGGGSDHQRSWSSGGSKDREPGELSSGSGSDDTNAPPQSKGVDNVCLEVDGASLSPLSKKRKYSPIVWERDDDDQSRATPSRGKIAPLDNVALPPPPLPQGFIHSNSIEVVRPEGLSSPVGIKLTQWEQNWSNSRKPGQLEEEEDYYISAWNISTSRWADGNSALEDDESEHIVGESSYKMRKSPMDDVEPLRLQKEVTPELGEFSVTDTSDRVVSGLAESGGEGEVDSQNTEDDEKDHMVLEHEDVAEGAICHQSDKGSEEGVASVTPEPVHPQQRSINMLQGCRSVHEFERLNRIGEGTYGVVFRAKDKKTGEVVALKKVKMEKERDGFPLTSLREINILLSFHHSSIVNVKEVVMDGSLDSIFMVMEYMEHDLKGLMETMKQPFTQSEVKCLMLQLLEGVQYLHDSWVLHRDLKTSNILLNNRGELKICDFGMSRQYGSPLKPYTSLVVTLWYRAPELLLGAKEYSTAIDMWSLGCIMAELLAKESLFDGKNEIDQLNKIFKTLGTPNEMRWPGFSKLPGVKANFVKQPLNKLSEKFPPMSLSGRPTLSEAGVDLLNKLLTYDPTQRITAKDALNHGWFREVPLPKSKDFMPTFPALHAQDRRSRRLMKSPDPLEELLRKKLQGKAGTHILFG